MPRLGIIEESACSLICRARHIKESISIEVMNSAGKVVIEHLGSRIAQRLAADWYGGESFLRSKI